MFNKSRFWKEIEKNGLDGEMKIDEPMKFHTTWKIGGVADFFYIPKSQEALKNIVLIASERDLPIYIIGNGSNILVSDDGIRGLVIKIAGTLDKIEYFDKMIKVGAGVILPHLVKMTIERELSGLEFASHIPGTLGGAIMNNASFGGESLANIVHKISLIDFYGHFQELDSSQFTFLYRGILINLSRYILLNAEIRLARGDKTKIITKVKDFYKQRKASQPLAFLTAGCIFKNPQEKPAGYLIEQSGAKGLRIGDAQVSEKHANFIINCGRATSKDILLLIEKIEERVEKNFGIKLEREINILGFGRTEYFDE
ncbi:MAG: UDP-N-acetylmuramate dehydrogenase [Candidatus Atribacteria bacterium]|nr:UDP-N-acetylmuramate dehydrogenase [Candidatus Atribacteria bacterium]